MKLDGLRWLARHQSEDGTWRSGSLEDRCTSHPPCYDPKAKIEPYVDAGLTGLALLCFVRAGYGPDSKAEITDPLKGNVPAGPIVRRTVDGLVAHQKPDGSFTPERVFMYNEAIATLALTQTYVLSKDEKLHASVQKAVDFLESAQRYNPSGNGMWGWRYESRLELESFHAGHLEEESVKQELSDADTSVTGWVVDALDAARTAGFEVKKGSLEGALHFCEAMTVKKGLVGYVDPRGAGATVSGPNDKYVYHPATMSALGMRIQMTVQPDSGSEFLRLAAERCFDDKPSVSKDQLSIDYYYWNQATRALELFDRKATAPTPPGKYWTLWKRAAVEALRGTQDHKPKACSQGGWIIGDRWSYIGGPIYCTAMNVLTLEALDR